MTRSTFSSAALQRRFENDGAVEFRLFSTDRAAELCEEILTQHHGSRSGWYSSNESRDHDYRQRVHQTLTGLLTEPLAEILDDHLLFNTSLLIKWTGPDSEMGTHQDWSFVDEVNYRSLTVWCPLVDVGPENGALEVLQGSHRVLTHQRCSPSLPEDYDDPLHDLGEGDLSSWPLLAGKAIALDHALAHRSPPNRTSAPRVAIAATFAPREAELHHHYRDPQGRIWDFAIPDAAWFRTSDIGERPRDVPCRGQTAFAPERLSADELLARCQSAGRPPGKTRSVTPLRSRLAGFFRSRRHPPVAPALPDDANRTFRPQTFVATALDGELRESGYVVVDLLDPETCTDLRAAYDHLDHGNQWDSEFAPGFHTTMYDPRPEYRRAVLSMIDDAMSTALDSLLLEHRFCLANFTVKLADGEPVPGHLDWSFVDEAIASSVTVWCALEDTTEENGALTLIPGSHKHVDFIRPVNLRDYDRHTAVAGTDRSPVSVPIRAGQAIVMDNRMVHGSSANRSGRTRVAAAAVMAPQAVPMHHYWVDDDDELVELEVSSDFYLNYAIGPDPRATTGVLSQRVLQGVDFA